MRKKLISIFLSLVFLFSLILAQYAQAAAVNATNLRNMFDQLDNQKKWNSYKSIVDDGAIAWGEGLVMRSYLSMYETTKDKHYLELFIGHADSLLKRRDSERGVKDHRGLSLPAWRVRNDSNVYYIYAVHTGVIVTPLAQFAAIVQKDPSLSEYQAKAAIYAKAAKDAIDVHDMSAQPKYKDGNSTWIEDGNSMYLDRPINMNLAQGSAMLAIYEATGDKTYLNKAIKIANYFKKHLTVNKATNSYTWKYYPDSRYSSVIEDISHSSVDVEFIYLAYRNGIFSESDMQKFANTASKVLVKKDGTIAKDLNGGGTADYPGMISHWLVFEPWAPSLFNVTYNIFSSKSSVIPNELAGAALLNYTFARNNRQEPDPAPVPSPTPTPTPDPEGNLIQNGNFSEGAAGWVNTNNTALIKNDANGNKYLTNTYNFSFYQVLTLEPGVYKLNANTRKGTAELGARIVLRFYHKDGTETFKTFTHKNSGSGWEDMPEMTVEVPSTAKTIRLYLSAGKDDTGTQDFDDITLVPETGAPAPQPTPDTEAPQTAIATPAAGSTLKDAVTLEATASDNVGVTQLTLAYATDAQGSWTTIGEASLSSGNETAGTWQSAWDVSGLANGTYYMQATARDAAGNIATSDPVVLKINNIKNLIENGNFNEGAAGWVNTNNTALIKSEANGNKYLTNTYNFTFYQVLTLEPGTYQLNAKTRKGTAKLGARIVLRFYHKDGTESFKTFTYQNSGSGWETMPQMTVEVPSTAKTIRLYLSAGKDDTGTQDFDDITLSPVN